MLLALTLPISSTNPMFVTKYMNFEACSWYDPAWSHCKHGPSISTYQPVTTVPYLGMLWHGTALAHQALTDTVKNSCAATTSNQMVIPIVNKQWHNGVGGGGAYHPSWAGPGGFGRTVAAIGVDNALLGQLSAASTRPDLSWKIGSTQDWHDSLHSLLTCMDTKCCDGSVSKATGIPKSGKSTRTSLEIMDGKGTGTSSFEGNTNELNKMRVF